MTRMIARTCAVALLVVLAGCGMMSGGSGGGTSMSAAEGGWVSLQSLSAWRGYKSQDIPAGWAEVDGMISKTGDGKDLVSRKQYMNFELSLDWMLGPGGNSGLFYRATEEYEHIYWSGPEFQLLDNARHPDGRQLITQAGSVHSVYAPPPNAANPSDTWNSTRIIVNGSHVEHWLNEKKVVEYELGSADWAARVKASKFGVWPNYGLAPAGYIGIQGDHAGKLLVRNMKVRELP